MTTLILGLLIGQVYANDLYPDVAHSLNARLVQTSENLTLTINPDTGVDPSVNTTTRITTQAQSDAYGDFASVQGALRALPPYRAHQVDLVIDDGTYTISGRDFFDGLRRNVAYRTNGFPALAQLYIRSDSVMTRVGGTTTSNVASDTDNWDIVLSADPGYSANEHRGKYLMIESGSGVGEYRPLRDHSGTSARVAGSFTSIDATSTVGVFEPAVTLSFALPQYINATPNQNESFVDIVFQGLSFDVSAAPGKSISFYDGSFMFDGVFTNATFNNYGRMVLGTLSVDSTGNGIGFSVAGGTVKCGYGFLIWGSSSFCMYVQSAFGQGSVYMYRGAFVNCGTAVKLIYGATAHFYFGLHGDGNTVGIDVGHSTTAKIDISYAVDASGGIEGSTADVIVGGKLLSYQEVEAYRSANPQPASNLRGYVDVLLVEPSTTAGTGTLTFTLSGTTLAYTAPGDSVGSAVNVGAGGEFVLKSNNNEWLQVWVNPTLPSGDASDTFTVRSGSVVSFNNASLEVY